MLCKINDTARNKAKFANAWTPATCNTTPTPAIIPAVLNIFLLLKRSISSSLAFINDTAKTGLIM